MAAKKESTAPTAAGSSDKKKALETAMQQIEKLYGKGSIMRYGDNSEPNVEAIPTGSLALDVALGIGQADDVLRIMRSFGFGDLEITPDPGGIPRVVQGRLYDEI